MLSCFKKPFFRKNVQHNGGAHTSSDIDGGKRERGTAKSMMMVGDDNSCAILHNNRNVAASSLPG